MSKDKSKDRSGEVKSAGKAHSQIQELNTLFVGTIGAFLLLGLLLLFVLPGSRTSYFTTAACLFVVAFLLRIMQITFPGKFKFVVVRERALTFYESLGRHQKLYVNFFLLAIFLGYVYVLSARDLFPSVSILFFVYCFGIAAYDVVRVYQALSNTLLGKALIALGFAAGSNLAFSFAGFLIGEMTHVAPSTFPHTLSFLAIGAIPFLFITVGIVYIPIAMLVVPFFWMAEYFEVHAPGLMKWLFARKFEKPVGRFVVATLLFQVFFYSFLVTMGPKIFFLALDRYGGEIDSVIANSIYKFDMYRGGECNDSAGYRVAGLGDENYILASKTLLGVVFEKPRKCTLKES